MSETSLDQLPLFSTRKTRTISLDEAVEETMQNRRKGLHCPCCSQWVQEYDIPFHSGMARMLYHINRIYESGRVPKYDFFHVEDMMVEVGVKIKGVHGKLKIWGMLEQKPNEDTKKHHSGFWRITEKGLRFLSGTLRVPRTARCYNKDVLGFDGPDVTIHQVWEDYFDYTTMMEKNR